MQMTADLESEMLRIIFNSTDDCVFVTEKDGALIHINPAAKNLFGIPAGEGPGKKIWEFIPIIEQNDNIIQLFIDGVREKRKTHQA